MPRRKSAFVLAAVLSIAGAAAFVHAQTPAATFDVVSVKPSNPNPASPLGAVPMAMPSAGRFTGQNLPLRLLVRIAYDVQDFQITGGPGWQMSDKFDIVARTPSPETTLAQMRPMLRALLEDRFKLKAHTEQREMPTYALVMANKDGKLGPNIKPSTAQCGSIEEQQQKLAEKVSQGGAAAQEAILAQMTGPCAVGPWQGAPGGFGMRFAGQPIGTLVQLLTQATGRIVQDKTGLQGNYDYELAMDPQVLMAMAAQVGVNLPANPNLPGSDNPALLTAIQEQLGLKVESQRAPVDMLVIDSAEKPVAD